ncbi:MAG: hypothetical protein CVV24_09065 [Ignavibacteriae bacterium HGW-Ignavibacteriae-3]|nr:MAG: hypothetical protein CVV24_09065 [Ignavibacteriae bacterium HGW-Ignavibacteriae-3]
MKIKKHFKYKSHGQIWRILISDSDKLIIETRDRVTKEVFYQCYELGTGKSIFTDLQLEDKFWVGIEGLYKNIIYFHKFPKPDMPGHKQIIAFDIASQKTLWSNTDLSFLFIDDDLVYGFQQGFEERTFYALDYLSGAVLKEFGNDYKTINMLRAESEEEKDWSDYLYPKKFTEAETDLRVDKAVKSKTENLAIEGEVEYNFSGDLLCFNFHSKVFEGSFVNRFFAVNLSNGKLLLDEVLNANATALFTDSFFVYKNFLFLLREKNEVIVYALTKT